MSYAENEKEILRGMAEMFEEFKPFPKDKVNKQIDKTDDKYRAHQMKAVKNFRTKVTDPHKAKQKHVGKDGTKTIDQVDRHIADLDKHQDTITKHKKKADKHNMKAKSAESKGKENKRMKHDKKAEDHTDAYHDANKGFDNSYKRSSGILNVDKTMTRASKDDIDKQAAINRKSKEDRASAKASLDRAGLEGALKAKPKREKMKGPKIKNTIKKESMNKMNFTNFLIEWDRDFGGQKPDPKKPRSSGLSSQERKNRAANSWMQKDNDRIEKDMKDYNEKNPGKSYPHDPPSNEYFDSDNPADEVPGKIYTKNKKKLKKQKAMGEIKKGSDTSESMNFTEYLDSAVRPLYEKEGEVPKCPPGYKYDVEMKMCVPKTNKDSIGKDQKYGNKDMKPGNGAGYNVWGNSGYSGAGFAWEEGPTDNDRAGGQE